MPDGDSTDPGHSARALRSARSTQSTSSARSLRSDTRGVSPVIGAVLMLALAMLLTTVLQTTAIPALNAQHEFQHNQEVQTDLLRLETTVDRVAATGTGETGTVTVGLRYPPRLVFVNPPPVSGTLRTTSPEPVMITNAATDGETGDYWDGTVHTYPTTTLAYSPSYNEYGSAPVTVYEPWVVYNRMDGGTAPMTRADLVDGRRIAIVALDGEYATSGAGTVGVNAEPSSAPVETVTVRNDTDPITVTLPTGLRNDTWTRLLRDEFDRAGAADDRHVTGIDCLQEPPAPCGELTLTFEPGTYDLRLGEVAVGTGSSPEPAVYLTDVEGDLATVAEGGRQRIVVEARDRFDNPVSGVTVDGALGGSDGSLRAVTPVTGTDGRAVFVYAAPDDIDASRSVTVTTRFGGGDRQRTVTFDLRLIDLDGSDGGSTSAAGVEGVEGSVDSRNIGGSDRGREASFRIRSAEPVTITGFSVTTRGDLEGRPFVDRDTTFDGGDLPVTVDGEIPVALRDIESSRNLPISEFVDPTSGAADIVVVLEFADGSTRTLALG